MIKAYKTCDYIASEPQPITRDLYLRPSRRILGRRVKFRISPGNRLPTTKL